MSPYTKAPKQLSYSVVGELKGYEWYIQCSNVMYTKVCHFCHLQCYHTITIHYNNNAYLLLWLTSEFLLPPSNIFPRLY